MTPEEFKEKDTWFEEQTARQEYESAMGAFRKSLILSIENFALELANEARNAKTFEELEGIDDFLNSLCDYGEAE